MNKIATTLLGFLFFFPSLISAQDIIKWSFSLEDAEKYNDTASVLDRICLR